MKNNWMSNKLTVSLPMMIVCLVLTLCASAVAEGPGTGPLLQPVALRRLRNAG